MEKLKIIEPSSMKYNFESIFFKSDKGNFEMSLDDAWELAFCFLDATGKLNREIEKVMEDIDKEYKMGKY